MATKRSSSSALVRFDAWSYSRLHDYDTCPRKAKLKHLDKITEPPNKAMDRGARIHKLAEDYVKGSLRDLPEELSQFRDEFKQLLKLKADTETRWAFGSGWKPLEGFFDKQTVARVVTDALVVEVKTPRGKRGSTRTTALVVDYKTGRRYGSNAEQVQLYALAVLERYPQVEEVTVQLWYLDQGEIDEEVFARSKHHATLREYWEERPKRMMSDTAFKPTPGQHCARCYYSKVKHADCEF